MAPVDWLPDWLAYILYVVWLDQTLIAGLFAAIAAGFTVWFLRKQIAQTEIHRQEELRRRHRMLRAGLPAALAELGRYADDCIRTIWEIRHSTGTSTPSVYPELPIEAIRNIQAAIETADEPAVTDLENLIRFFQIQTSRLDSFATSSSPSSFDTADKIRDALFLKAATARLFSYARGQAAEPGEWYDSSWAKNQIPHAVLRMSAGSLPIDTDLDEQIDRHWDQMRKSYGE